MRAGIGPVDVEVLRVGEVSLGAICGAEQQHESLPGGELDVSNSG
ncbi:MAG: hypothetical protein QOF69_3428 [Solirubrobacteraceae bacterium]|nr:hypothetical protein [Solirubrobacteraceae bacterium]